MAPEGGLFDVSETLPSADIAAFNESAHRLHRAHRIAVLAVVDANASAPRTATILLKSWTKPADRAQALVIHAVLETGSAELAASPALAVMLDSSRRDELLDKHIRPALAVVDANRGAALGSAFQQMLAELEQEVVLPPTELGPAPAQPTLAQPPIWRMPALWIVVPSLFAALLLGSRLGWWVAIASLLPLALLYGGLYLLVRFGTPASRWALVLSFAPLLVYFLAQKPQPRYLRRHDDTVPTD